MHDHHDHDVNHPHEHEHNHEHTHVHAHEHTHENGETHTHPHEHTHSHEHHHAHDHAEGKPIDELLALMKYMTGHNAAHTRELEELAEEVHKSGQVAAYQEIMEAVRFFNQGNEALSGALEKMQK